MSHLIPVRTILAIAGKGTVDKGWIESMNPFVSNAQLIHLPRPKILNYNIGLLGEVEKDLSALVRF
jgi:hypothetical protein